ncbi:tetratricopeptide repeat protein 9B [Lampris incognitus]|uniref:tetratricopeptide repeat protein 9B n=1 Tax=Lampris incognitus TaxID=2546036 RepID=UPI0024B61589|nr:tetratricopeptide repeat protein 9B [Lampris incognitus]
MHSTLLQSSPRKPSPAAEQHGPLHTHPLRDMEAKQHPIKSLKSYPETGGRSLAAAAGGGGGGGGGAGGGGGGGGGDGGGGGGYRAGAAEMEMEAKIQKAVDFKAEGHRCYKEKKFREAIGKYHRALLQLKGVHVVDGTTGSEVNLLNQAAAKLTEEQRRAVEGTEIECYDSLTGERPGGRSDASRTSSSSEISEGALGLYCCPHCSFRRKRRDEF